MNTQTLDYTLASEQIRQYHEEGYLLIKGHFTPEEVAEIIHEADTLDAAGGRPGLYEPNKTNPSEQLARYPRIMHPNRSEAWAKHYMLHPKTRDVLRQLLDTEPLAAQSMFYWKPPGARGQAFHQDDFYLATQDGNCVACWVAIDKCDEENGAMVGVVKSHGSDIACPELADEKISFTRELVKPPAGSKSVLMRMEPGDAFFFNGRFINQKTVSAVHSSAITFRTPRHPCPRVTSPSGVLMVNPRILKPPKAVDLAEPSGSADTIRIFPEFF